MHRVLPSALGALAVLSVLALAGPAAAQFSTSNSVGTSGAACTTNGQYAWPDSNGQILKCNGSTWAVTIGTTTGGQWTTSGSNIYYSGGNVGIGTTSPLWPLDVRGTISGGNVGSTNGSVILQGYYDATGVASVAVWGTEYSSGAPMMGFNVTPSTSATSSFLSSTGVSNRARAAITVGGGSASAGSIAFFTGTGQTVGVGSPVTMSPVMTILNGGNVGIGTQTIANKLDVNGAASIGYVNTAAPSNGLIVSGNVGIGTSVVGAALTFAQGTTSAGGISFGGDTTLYRQSAGLIASNSDLSIGHIYSSYGITNGSDANNAAFRTPAGGPLISRNIADANPSLIVNQSNASSTGDILDLQAGGSTKVAVTQAGNVGIGTTSPEDVLVVGGTRPIIISPNNTAGYGYGVTVKANAGGWVMYHGFAGSGGAALGGFGAYGGTNALTRYFIGTATTGELMSITAGGNVGIGTTSPSYYLDVSGTGRLGATGTNGALFLSRSSDGIVTSYAKEGTSTGGMRIGNSEGNGFIAFEVDSGGHGVSGATERARIDVNGNVGIGTTTMANKLDVNGAASIGYVNTSAPSNGLIVSGNVGIGTNAPTVAFQVSSGDIGSTGRIRAGLGIGNSGAQFDSVTNTISQSAGYFRQAAASATAPVLIVQGGATPTSTSYLFTWKNSAATTLGVIDPSGNLGIGTSSPQATLDVVGYARLSLNSSQPAACSSTNQGALALNHLAQACACNGSSWIFADSTGASCSW